VLNSDAQLRAVQDIQPEVRPGPRVSGVVRIVNYAVRFLRSIVPSSDASSDTGIFGVRTLGRAQGERSLLVLALVGFAAHVVILACGRFLPSVSFLSNLLQVVLGILAVMAMVDAGTRSGSFGRRTWLLAALALGGYTIGQVVFTYTYTIAQPHSRQFGAVFYDPIFFFWIVPLIAAALADPAEIAAGFEWTSILDFSLLVVLALALHFSAFADTSQWHGGSEEVLFWRLKVRLIRDLIVLACLWSRFVFTDSNQVRALFLRLGTFYFTYAVCNIVYFNVIAATHGARPDNWIDLVWSVPRVLAIAVAATWSWRQEIAVSAPAAAKWRGYVLDHAPLVVPLLILGVSSHMFTSSPWIWGGLIATTLGIVSLRLRVTQLRQNRTVERLHRSTNLLQSIIEGTSEAVYLKDAQGRYLLMNPAGARGLKRTPEEIVGKTDYELFSAPDAEALIKNDKMVMSSGEVVTTEEAATLFGIKHTFLTTKNPYRDPSGQIIGVLGISVDITERRRIEQHLQKSQRMESIGTFSSGMAHDFNNLLTVIKGYSYLAHVDAEDNPAIRESVDQINKAAARASSLIDNLLAFSRRQILQPRVINLNDIVSQLRKMLDRLIGEDVRIQTQLAADLGNSKADPGQIEQVLMNLAANARDAMPSGGVLSLQTANVSLNRSSFGPDFNVPPGSYVCLTVSDTGIGMDVETRARVFEPFFTTKPSGKGTGLGLATVYGIVKQSGGFVGVESEPESGATFRIYLPRVNEPVDYLAQVTARPAPHGGHQTILVVDDDPQLRQLTRKVLTSSGFKVLEAEGREQAEQLAATHRGSIDMLLTDVVMPEGNGREIAQQICGNGSKTRVLYMSGYPNDTIVHHGMLDPGIRLLKKPFSPARLVEQVREVLQDPVEAHSEIA
jgi:PAS domain S-box-containing protein